MRLVNFFLSFIVYISIGSNVSAQSTYLRDLNDFMQDMKGRTPKILEKQVYKDIKGSPYQQNDFTDGNVVQNNGITYKKVPLRYNGYDDQIEFKDKKGAVMYIGNPESYKEFKIGSQIYIFRKNLKSKPKVEGYFELLEDGKLQLLKRFEVSLKKAEPAQAYSDPKPAEFIKKQPTYFIISNGNQIAEVRNEKDILELLPDQKETVSKYIKKNKLKVKREEDLRQVIVYYNSL